MFKAGSIYAEALIDDKKWKSGLNTLKKGAAVTGAAIAASLAKVMVDNIKIADTWQKSMTNVTTVIDTSIISARGLTKELLKLDPQLGSTTDLTNGLYQSFSSGAETASEAMQTTIDSAKFAKAAVTDTATAVDVLTTAVNAYGKENLTTTEAADYYFKTIEKGKITGAELSAVIGQSIPLFASAGIQLNELSAAIASMTKQGVKSAETTTQLNGIITAFIKPSEAMTEALKKQGYESGSALLKAEGLAGALQFLDRATEGSNEKLGEIVPNLRGMRGTLALTGEGAKIFNETLEAMADASGAVDIAFNKQEKTFETYQNSAEKIQIVTGNIGKHFIDQIAAGATEANKSILEMITGAEGMVFVANAAGAVASGLDFVKASAEPIATAIFPALKDILGTLLKSFGEVFQELFDGGPAVDQLAIAVNTASAAITIASKFVVGFIENIKNLTLVAIDSGELLWYIFSGQWGKVSDSAREAWEAIKDFGTGMITTTKDVITASISEFSDFGLDVKNTIKEIELSVTTSFETVKNDVLTNWEEIYTGFEETTDKIQEINDESNENLLDSTEDTNSKIKEWWQELWDDNVLTVKTAYEYISSAVSSTLNDLSSISSLYYGNELDKIDSQYQSEKEALDEKLANNLITQEEYDQKISELEDKHNEKRNEALKKQFKAQQKLDIANAIMTGASATIGWWSAAAQLGPIAGPIFAGVMTAATTALVGTKVALISKQQFVPQYATGGTKKGTGPAIINERGPEMVVLPDGTTVIPNDLSEQITNAALGKSSDNTIYVNFAGANISKDVDLDILATKVSKKLAKEMRTAV